MEMGDCKGTKDIFFNLLTVLLVRFSPETTGGLCGQVER